MFDKLELRTDSIKPEAIKSLGSKYDHSFMGDKNYRECHIFRDCKKHIVTIKTNPVFPNALPCSIELNPSCFEGFKKTNDLISQISEGNLTLKRIDFAIDINRPFEEIRKAIKAKHKRARHDYPEKDFFTGFELGCDQEVICVYDKAYELLKRRKYRPMTGFPSNTMTRIEIRQRAKKILFKNYSEIQSYLDVNPFKIIEFYKLTTLSSLSDHEQFKAWKLISKIDESGCLHGAVKRLNKNNNFKRDNTYLYRDKELELFIEKQFKENLTKFFGE